MVTGAVIGGIVTNKYRDIKHKKNKQKDLGTYNVRKDSEIQKIGLKLKSGDRIRVLATDEDSILIEKIGDKNNPYFVSFDFLKDYFNYKGSQM